MSELLLVSHYQAVVEISIFQLLPSLRSFPGHQLLEEFLYLNLYLYRRHSLSSQ